MKIKKENSKSIKRRGFLKTSGAAMAGFTIIPNIGLGQNVTELVFAFGPEDAGTVKKLVQNYNNLNRGKVRVTIREMARESDENYRQLVSDFSVESPEIDVLGADIPWTAAFAKNKWVVDVSKRLFNLYRVDDFVEASLNSAGYRFRMWGVPWYTDTGLLYYRKDLLSKSGYTQPPRTWDELKSMAKKVMADSNVPHGFVFQGAEYEGGTANAVEYIWNEGGRVLTGNISVSASFGQSLLDPNVITVNSIDAARGFDVARSMVTDGVTPANVNTMRELESGDIFLKGESVFMRSWPYIYGVLLDDEKSQVKPGQIGIAKLPSGSADKRAYSCLGGWNLMLNAFADDDKQDAAWDFIVYATAAEQQKFMSLDGGFMPTLAALYDDPEITNNVPTVAAGKEIIGSSRVRPVTPFYDQISPRIARVFNRVLTGGMSGDQAVETLQQELITILRRNR